MSTLLIFCVGDKLHGMGHVVRCLTLADALVASGFGVAFATQHETPGLARISRTLYPVMDYAPDDLSWTNRSGRYSACIIDVENGPTRILLEATRKFDKVIVIGGSGYIMQDRTAIRELADLLICQTILPSDCDLSGSDSIIIRSEYAQCVPDFDGHILISMGGSDPHGMTHRVIDALAGIDRAIAVVDGPASTGVIESDTLRVIHEPDSLAPYLNGAALFFGALGMSAFEAAAAGVPALLTAWSVDHEATTKVLATGDVAVNLGVWDTFDGYQMRIAVDDILSSGTRWSEMSRAGKALVDGQGAMRVVERIAYLLSDDSVMVMEPHAERIIHAEATLRPRKKQKGKTDES